MVHGNSRIAVVRIRNSLANTPKGGMPRIASVPTIRPQPTVGFTRIKPRIWSITCVPAFCAAWPTAKKMADFTSECTVMCNSPAKLAIGPPMPKAKVISPMCSIDEYANMRLMSRWREMKNAASTTESRPKPIIRSPAKRVPSAPSVSTLQRSTA